MVNILIADDSLEFVKCFSNYILDKYKNIRITNISTNGQEIIEKLYRDTKIDIILLDLDMPILNGVEFLKKMQYLKLQEYPRIIVISGMISKLLEVQNNKNVYVCLSKTSGFDFIGNEIEKLVNDIESNDIEKRIKKELTYIGMNLNHIGTKYLIKAILEVYFHPDTLYNLEKNIYTKISKTERKSISTIKSNILKAVNYMYVENEFDKIKEYFSMKIEEKPTPKLMISTIIDKIK